MNKFGWLRNIKKILETAFYANSYQSIQNWPLLLADYCHLLKGNYLLKLTKGGGKFHLRSNTADKWIVTEVILRDVYRVQPIANKSIRTVVDLGAHIGIFSILAKLTLPQAKIYSFEPEKKSLALLRRNIRLNRMQAGIYPFPLACSSQNSVQKFYLDHGNYSGSLCFGQGHYRLIRTMTLANILIENKIKICDLLKIDVEGAEYRILYSLPSRIFPKIRRIRLEYHNLDERTDLNGESLKKYLEQFGYSVIQRKMFLDKTGYLYADRQTD